MLRNLLDKVVSSVRGGTERDDAPARLRGEIHALEEQLKAAAPQRRAQVYNRLGDVYARGGARGEALKAYGRGIDCYLENGFYDAAAALCRKVIEYSPDVVRARCTLAFLSLGKEMLADADREVKEYIETARRAGQEELVIKRLHLMAEATDSLDTRGMLGERLLELGDVEGADRVLGAVNAERNEPSAALPEDQRERWARLLRVAITDATDEDEDEPPLEKKTPPRRR